MGTPEKEFKFQNVGTGYERFLAAPIEERSHLWVSHQDDGNWYVASMIDTHTVSETLAGPFTTEDAVHDWLDNRYYATQEN